MLNFIGLGSAFNTELGNNSCFIKNNNEIFIIDCGADTFSRLLKYKILNNVDIINIFITHTHTDHIGSLSDLVHYSFYSIKPILNRKINIFSAETSKIKKYLELTGVTEEQYNLKETLENCECKIWDNLYIYPFETTHVKTMKSFGLKLNFKNKNVFYSSDANYEFYLNTEINLNDFEYIYLDICKLHYDNNPHLSLYNLNELILEKQIDNKKIYCMHLDKNLDYDDIKKFNLPKTSFEFSLK